LVILIFDFQCLFYTHYLYSEYKLEIRSILKGIKSVNMSKQKVFGLLVTSQKAPFIEKPNEVDQCYICGFRFEDEDCMHIFTDEELSDRRKAHQKCIFNHLQLLSKETKVAIVSVETNEVISYTTVSEKA